MRRVATRYTVVVTVVRYHKALLRFKLELRCYNTPDRHSSTVNTDQFHHKFAESGLRGRFKTQPLVAAGRLRLQAVVFCSTPNRIGCYKNTSWIGIYVIVNLVSLTNSSLRGQYSLCGSSRVGENLHYIDLSRTNIMLAYLNIIIFSRIRIRQHSRGQ